MHKRETPLGRWVPLVFYVVNLELWNVTGLASGAGDLLWLVVWPLPAGVLYWWRTRGRSR